MHAPLPSDPVRSDDPSFSRLSAGRLLVLGGIGLIFVGMLFGDIFAVFMLHQNAARVGGELSAAAHAALHGDSASVAAHFRDVGSFLENRGTKVDTHVHMIDFGYLSLLLALVQPWVTLTEKVKRAVAWLFLSGAVVLPVGVFLIHYVGLAYSPLQAIGWASIFADLGGLCVLLAMGAYLAGLWRQFRAGRTVSGGSVLAVHSAARQRLLAGGLALVLLGFAHGAYYAASDLYRQEAEDYSILSRVTQGSVSRDSASVDLALAAYGQLQGDKAVKIAAHAHSIEFGLLAMMLAFFQPHVSLSERWKQRWVFVLLLGSVMLPVCVLLELRFGLVAGGLADVGGLLVIVALLAMWIGIARYARECDAGAGTNS
jgi:hypothetical protein